MASGFDFLRKVPPLETPESLTLEFKTEVSLGGGFEQAKDVAAMANAQGGTLLVGAVEAGRRLVRFKPVAEAHAKDLSRAYEEAVRDRCVPPPVVAVEVLPCDGGHLVAVHVTPSVYPVAVRLRKGEAAARTGPSSDAWSGDAWVYFLRVATQNKEVSPETLALAMSPDVRRITILLRSIPFGAPIMLHGEEPSDLPKRQFGDGRRYACVVVAPEENAAYFANRAPREDEPLATWARTEGVMVAPLSRISEVYRGAAGWKVYATQVD